MGILFCEEAGRYTSWGWPQVDPGLGRPRASVSQVVSWRARKRSRKGRAIAAQMISETPATAKAA